MKKLHILRRMVAFVLIASMVVPAVAQSGRRPVQKTGQAGSSQSSSNKSKSGQTPAEEDSKSRSDKPLADNTPVTVTDDGTIKLETSMVTIPVSVSDRDGKFMPDLKKRDFKIYENEIEQEIESFESVEVPFHVVLLIDTSNSTRFKMEEIHSAAIAFTGELRSDDEVMVISFDSEVRVQCEFTSDRGRLREAIYQTRTGGSTKLYEAVDLAVNDAFRGVTGRKAIVLFTDGVDTSSRRSSAEGTLIQVEEADVLVFPIRYDTEMDNPNGGTISNPRGIPPIFNPLFPANPRSRVPRWPWPFINHQFPGQWPQGRLPIPGTGGAGDYRKAERYLQDLADRSGGKLYYAENVYGLSRAFTQIAEELRHQYALSYYPTNGNRDGSYRKIRVRVTQTGAVVRAREGYRAVADTQAGDADSRDDRKRPVLKRRQLAEK
ncbi:MAG: VWA domain-containing protein [Acidobacteria bacterium]|nr:VWA domain-containing protein [Acidobacteriota bacterium]